MVHFLNGSGTADTHGGVQSANKVLAAVGDRGGSEKNLLQRSGGADFDAGAPG